MKRPVGIAVTLLGSLGLLYILASHAELTWSNVASSVGSLGWPVFVCVLALTSANLVVGTFKWLLVMRAVAPDCGSQPRFVDGMLTTTLGALLGQVMPVQVGVALTRSLAGRLGVGRSPGVNLGTTAYEQFFDAVVLGLAGAVGLLGLVFRPGAAGWLMLILLVGSIGLWALVRGGYLLTALPGWLSRTRFSDGYISKFANAAAHAVKLSPPIFMQLMVLSVLRYAMVLLRAVIVLSGLGMSVFAVEVIQVFPLVQVIGVLPLTPGNLGVMELTWSGVLVYAGAAVDAAVLFAISVRIVSVAAQAILLCFFVIVRLLPRVSTA